MLGKGKCFELLEAALGAGACDQSEMVLYVTDESLTRFAESVIHQNVAERDAMTSVRAVMGKRIGVARGNQLTTEAVRGVASRALELAKVSAPDPKFASLPEPAPLPEVKSYAEATAASTPEDRAAAVRQIVAITEKHGCVASGSLSVETMEVAIGNSLGVRAYAPATRASLVVVVADDQSSGYGEWYGWDIAGLDVRRAAETAVRKCVEGRGAQPLEPGSYPVILEPAAVDDMLGLLSWIGLGANAYQEGRSFMSGRMGERVVGENVTIWDDATDPRNLPIAFDWEGVPKRSLMLIENGVARGIAYDSYTAHKDGVQSTGHAFPAPNTAGPLPVNLFLEAGAHSEDEMIASMERGLLVSRFHYTNIVHEKQTIITGMTRDGTFLIEDGKVARPIQNLRFTQSITDALSNLEMIGRECVMSERAYVPAVKVGAFSFTS
jgi:PmbA protein